MRCHVALWLYLALSVACAGGSPRSGDAQTQAPALAETADVSTLPPSLGAKSVLQWNRREKTLGFAQMEQLRPARTIRRGTEVRPFERVERPLEVSFDVDGESWTLDTYVDRNLTAGLLIVHSGRIAYEKYGLGHSAKGRWTSFSVAKSLTSTLVGAAIKDGAIGSLEDPLTRYLPQLAGSGYDGVTVRQLLTMTSGVRWNEDYSDPESDVARFLDEPSKNGSDATVTYMARLAREAEPGTRWHYNTGEANLVGSLVTAATGQSLADYLSEKLWSKLGMEQDGAWLLNKSRREIAGCCVSASLRDFGRFGLFFMNGAHIDGGRLVPEGWITAATTSTEVAEVALEGRAGYGFQWWTTPGPAYRASGIFGQGIYLNPQLELVVVTQSAWDAALDALGMKRRRLMIAAVEGALRRRGS